MTQFKNTKFKIKFKKDCKDKMNESEYKNKILTNINKTEEYI